MPRIGCVTAAWDYMGTCVGAEARARNTVFSGQAAAAPNEGQLVCEVVAAGVPLTRDWFVLGVLRCAVVRVRVGIGWYRVFWNAFLQIAV